MKRLLTFAACCLSTLFAFANDGVFYAAGNQLIPITETDISVKKEVLTLNRVGNHIEVTVYYEFFNPVGEKELLVGFEAESAYNGKDPMSTFPKHPHIRNFKVVVNDVPLNFEVAHVERGSYNDEGNYVPSQYYVNGRFQSWTRKQIEDTMRVWDYMDCPVDYVYHFKATFHPGLNIIKHTYDFDLSNSVDEEYYFPYVLTAANRWANHQIDNFQLNINMGPRESFHILPEFFKSPDEWKILGKGRISTDTTWWLTEGKEVPVFHIQEGGLIFRKTNFHPDGELRIHKRRLWSFLWSWDNGDKDDAAALIETVKEQYHPLWIPDTSDNYSSINEEQRRILKNLPFAYRGYIFKTKSLQDFFESTEWYLPNPKYDGNMEVMTEDEKKWVEFWE